LSQCDYAHYHARRVSHNCMRIIVAHKFYYRHAGAERYVFDVSELLEKHGHEVIPFAMEHPKNLPSKYSEYFVRYVEMGWPQGLLNLPRIVSRMVYSWEAKWRFAQLVAATKPDLVFIHNIYHQISPSILDVCRTEGLPVVQMVHDYNPVCPNYKLFANGQITERCKDGKFYRDIDTSSLARFCLSLGEVSAMYVHAWMGIYKKNIDFWVCPSRFTKEKLIEFGLPRSQVVELPYCLELPKAIKAPRTKEEYLLCFGRLSDEKGFDVAIRAMEHLPGLVLKIAGSGPMEEELQSLTESLGLSGRVEFLGLQSPDEVKRLIAGARLVVMPSIWYEVFPYSITESFAQGTIVIGSNMGAVEDMVGSIDKRLLFQAGNPEDLAKTALFWLDKPKMAEKVGQQGKIHFTSLMNPEKHYEALLKLFKRASKHHSI